MNTTMNYMPVAYMSNGFQWSNRNMPKFYNPPPKGFCKKVDLHTTDNIGLVIGKNGAVFNAITHQTPDLTYIWFNRQTKSIEVWGDTPMSVHMGYRKILDRIDFVRKNKNV